MRIFVCAWLMLGCNAATVVSGDMPVLVTDAATDGHALVDGGMCFHGTCPMGYYCLEQQSPGSFFNGCVAVPTACQGNLSCTCLQPHVAGGCQACLGADTNPGSVESDIFCNTPGD